jgi:hypothetical protein
MQILIYNYPMPNIKFDYLIEAIHYSPAGEIQNLRLFERRGPSFSDRLIFSREQVIEALQNGKKVVTGSRKSYLASTFDLNGIVQLSGNKENPTIVLGEEPAAKDFLPGIPVY